MIGQKLSPILTEIEGTLWEFEANTGTKPEYTLEGFRAATKIFMSALMDKIWELQSNEKMTMEDRGNMVIKVGSDVRNLIKTYTDLDMHEVYKSL